MLALVPNLKVRSIFRIVLVSLKVSNILVNSEETALMEAL